MKGVVNCGLINEIKEGEEKMENCLQIEGEDSKKQLNEFKESQVEDRKISTEKINKLAEIILKSRSLLKKKLSTESSVTKRLLTGLLHGIALAILVASIIQYFKSGSSSIDYCDGVGFFWILYILLYICIAHSFFKKITKNFWNNNFQKIGKKFFNFYSYRYFHEALFLVFFIAFGIYILFYPGKSGRRIYSFMGMIVFTAIGFVFSKYPGHVKWRTVLSGMFLQLVFGLIVINWESGRSIFSCIGSKVTRFLMYSEVGANFVYGPLTGIQGGGDLIFAFTALPVIFFLSFFLNILSYYGILQWVILKVSWVVWVVMDTTACESVNAVASIFLGMTETPLLIKNYLKDLTKSEISAILCAGWSTVAGVVMAAYIKFGVKASHLVSASIMSAPASLSFSKLFYPEVEEPQVSKTLVLKKEDSFNCLDAATKGALSAIMVVFSIIANIIAILSFVAFLDGIVNWIGVLIGVELSIRLIVAKIFFPVSFLIGVDSESLEDVAYLVGIKTVANEFQAYKQLGELMDQNILSERSQILATYALCGFSNIGSIGISVAALSAVEPSISSKVSEVAFRAFIASNIVCFMTACIAGCIID